MIEEKWTLPRYNKMQECWERNGPPVYMAVAGYLGLIPDPDKSTQGDLRDLVRQFPKGF